MDTPGSVLKTERERQNKALSAIEKTLNIRANYIQAIESDNYEQLPPEIFLKAYLRMYAEILGLDHAYILKLYETQKGGNHTREPEPGLPGTPHSPFSLNQLRLNPNAKTAVLAFVILAIILLTFSVVMKFQKDKPQTGPADELQKIETTPEPDVLTLKVAATNLTWVSIRVDGAKPKEWLLRSGDEITLTAVEKFAVKIGNAGGTQLILNGKNVGMLGPHGKVVDIVLP